jgi:hypothetical protein
MATATRNRVAEVEATTEQIREAVRALRRAREDSQGWYAATAALVSEIAQIAVSNADQDTRVRLVTEAADTFEKAAMS